jgi:protein phosphatase
MLTCSHCQFTNPSDYKFCQRCGKPLKAVASDKLSVSSPGSKPDAAVDQKAVDQKAVDQKAVDQKAVDQKAVDHTVVHPVLQVNVFPPTARQLSPETFLDNQQRYRVTAVLDEGSALVEDKLPTVRSPLQNQLPTLTQATLESLQSLPDLPAAAYPYLLLHSAAPPLYDAWQQEGAAILITQLITQPHKPALAPLLQAFSGAVDPLQPVYWLYTLTDLWAALEPLPQWRYGLLLADNLGIDGEQSVRVREFLLPGGARSQDLPSQSPQFADFKSFLQSLVAQPHQGAIAPLWQMRQLILTVASANTLTQLQGELAAIGESLLATPAAITPNVPNASSTNSPAATTATAAPLSTAHSATLKPNPMEETPPNSNAPSEATPALGSQPAAPSDTASAAVPALLEESIPQNDADSEDELLLGEPTDSGESTMVLPMKLISVDSAGRTDIGRQRNHNEDCFFIDSSTQKRADNRGQTTQTHSLYVLCDGMGGHAGGEVASQLAAETLSRYFAEHWPHPLPGTALSPLPSEEHITAAVKLSNQAIFDINEKEGRAGHERMGTTLVMVLLQGTEAVVAHVGDSRLYQHSRRLGLRQITTDHEVGQREIQRGIPQEIAYARPDAYQLTQALGPRDSKDLMPSIAYFSFSEDTLLLLCSDGLSDNQLVEDHVESHLDPILRGKKEIATSVDDLINLGNEINGHDNISAIAIRIKVSPDLEAAKGRSAPNSPQTILQ